MRDTSSQPAFRCGRSFEAKDLDTIREIIASPENLNRRQIATRTCEVLSWVGENGRLKEMQCRVALLRMDRLGLIKLPPPRMRHGNHKKYLAAQTLDCPLFPPPDEVGLIKGLTMRPVESRADSLIWNEAISRFHYLGYTRLPGAQMRYLIESSSTLLAVIGFAASAWKIAPRDRWIGWSVEQRERRVNLIVNNSRFLILPWIKVRNLASWILGCAARRLREDWQRRYGFRPVLLETFVETGRFRGTCYQAANWQYLGETQGRGKLDRMKLAALPVKKIYVYPLVDTFRQELCA